MALEKLKDLLKKNVPQTEAPKVVSERAPEIKREEEDTSFGKTETQSYEDWGFESAKKQNGNKLAFTGFWSLVKEYYRKIEILKQYGDNKDAQKAEVELSKKEREIEQKQSIISGIKDKIQVLKEKIDNLKKDIIRIKENPETILPDKASKLGFIIGCTILAFLTIYLFVFYSSAAYSAMFKEFTIDELGVASSIFDPKAVERAFERGAIAPVLILTIPFVFLGLGYLIHKFQEAEGIAKYFKIALLIAITFAFDAILAFEITQKIYNILKENKFQEMPEYSISMALSDINFWLIIFAGFVVYIIWGFVFDLTMEAYDKLNIVALAIKAKESEIRIIEDDVDKHNKEIDTINEHIHKVELEVIDLKKIVNGEVFKINWNRFYQCVGEFTTGWTHWMTANKKETALIDDIHKQNEILVEEHKKSILAIEQEKK
ncbi:MAG: hypothetical protein ACTTJM_03645 [Bergeyella cardium]